MATVVIATTGGFTNSLAQPEGFTVSAGEVINAAISPERHALVLVDRAGGLNVLDLRAQQQSLPDGKVIGNPIRSLAAYAQLLDWCRNHQATVFQTQLLAAQNQVLVDPAKAIKDKTKEVTKDAIDSATDKVEEAKDKATDKVKETGDAVKDATKDATDSLRKKTGEALKKAGEKIEGGE